MTRAYARWLTLMLAAVICGCGSNDDEFVTGGNYPPVSTKMLTNAGYSHRTGQDDPALDWKFTSKVMELVSQEEALPAELVEAVIGESANGAPRTVKKITATWAVSGETLTLTNIRADDKVVEGERTLRVYYTGVIRIDAADDQYVFGPKALISSNRFAPRNTAA